MSINFLNKKSNNFSSVVPNVFIQDEEPSIKEGIWLKNNELAYEKIVVDKDIVAYEEWDTFTTYPDLLYDFYSEGYCTYINGDIYFFRHTYAWKYNIATKSSTKLADIPKSFESYVAATIGTDVYLFNCADRTSYKYDTLTDNYKLLSGISYNLKGGSAVAIGTDICIFGGNTSSYTGTYVYKYDTLTNKLTSLANVPYSFGWGSCVLVKDEIHLLGGYDNIRKHYKYNPLNNSYTKLSDIPSSCRSNKSSAVVVGNSIYLFGGDIGSNSYTSAACKYDTLTDTYTMLPNIPSTFADGGAIFDGNDIYVLGGRGDAASSYTKIRVMNLVPKEYPNNSIIISQGNYDKYTQILNNPSISGRLLQYFRDAWFYTTENGLYKTIPTYYGDGTQWIKFKN